MTNEEIVLRCNECEYEFLYEGTDELNEVMIQCPYCKFTGKYTQFVDVHKELENDPYYQEKNQELMKFIKEHTSGPVITPPFRGYKKDFCDFQDFLKEATTKQVKMFFEDVIKIYTVHFKNGNYLFTDSGGTEVSVSEIHEYIQSDVVLQRKFYNWWYPVCFLH